jgi:Domain of unknown function (DUF1937)
MSNHIAAIKEATTSQLEGIQQQISDAKNLFAQICAGQAELERTIVRLRKELVDRTEERLRRDIALCNRLGLIWPPDLTFAEVIETAWAMRGQREGRLIYLASPYSHAEEHIKQARFEQVMEATAYLLADGHFIYSPILHNHPMATRCGIPGEWSFWNEFDTVMIARCDELWVLDIEGWLESTGVQAELVIAQRRGISSYLLERVNGRWERGVQLFVRG